jgi:hypothetical protein
MKINWLLLIVLLPFGLTAQTIDSTNTTSLPFQNITSHQLTVYKKPKLLSFVSNIPNDFAGFTKQSFQRKNLLPIAIIAGSTAVLYLADQNITYNLQDYSEDHWVSSKESFSPILKIKIGGKQTNIGKLPRNINTAFYDLGQGSCSMLIAAGFFITGEIKKDNRALQTANQLVEAFIALGGSTQLLKYATGRENPSDATVSRGRWTPFPAWSNFQNNKTKYDAFPSGHLATFVSTVAIISENYPEIKWIKPVGYSIAGLIGLSMINNGVHWASDFPLGVALGYGFGKFISRKSHFTFVP